MLLTKSLVRMMPLSGETDCCLLDIADWLICVSGLGTKQGSAAVERMAHNREMRASAVCIAPQVEVLLSICAGALQQGE